MCLISSPKKTIASPRSPWRRTLVRELVKPKLSRKIVPGARVNLNMYWHKFEEGKELAAAAAAANCLLAGAADDNSINENLANELQEFGK